MDDWCEACAATGCDEGCEGGDEPFSATVEPSVAAMKMEAVATRIRLGVSQVT